MNIFPCGGTAWTDCSILVAKEALSRVWGRDTGSMRDQWVHVGRLWTNGDPFLAVDAALRRAWHGYSNDDYDQVIPLSWQDTSVPVGAGRAVLVGADGVVGDDSWVEAFATDAGLVAIVQASGPDYPDVLARALGYPVTDDQDGDALKVGQRRTRHFQRRNRRNGTLLGTIRQCPARAGAVRSRPAPARGGPWPSDLSPAHRVQAQGPLVHKAR
jgi:hypothetical protein